MDDTLKTTGIRSGIVDDIPWNLLYWILTVLLTVWAAGQKHDHKQILESQGLEVNKEGMEGRSVQALPNRRMSIELNKQSI